jgi:hypothetical protein
MNIKTNLILATATLALLTAPASARFDGDEGAISAYAQFHRDRAAVTNGASAYASSYAVQPRAGAQRQHRVRTSHPQW